MPQSIASRDQILRRTDSHDCQRIRVSGKFFSRGDHRFRIRGVTYGPFAANGRSEPFPEPAQVEADFTLMQAGGVNSIRTYHVPPHWLLDLADQCGLTLLVDVPWPSHLCFFDSRRAQESARKAIHLAAERGREHPSLLAYSVGNEIMPSIVRWHRARRVERFLAQLADVCRQTDPDGLVTYANYPPTEYLNTSFADFTTFNVYLHDPLTFRRYLYRLQNLVGDRPLLLGEIGMDTYRHGEAVQARFLAGHAEETALMGLAGLYVFSWTDEWHTGGQEIRDWAFGITRLDRTPKDSWASLKDVFDEDLSEMIEQTPAVSVVVCSYNGGRTLEQCIHSLEALEYPNYEIIVVDDGSDDNTRDILERFPKVRALHQPNQGLSQARNNGLSAAKGEIVAFTDSDCYADPDWLTLLVAQLVRSGAAAVGGPNLAPDDGWLAACVAAAPGQPMHVLESDEMAEHIPGCNMAFRRDALLSINGFDSQFRTAGDDVDVCWRLQHAGHWITFAPGAFVWHHRRQTPRAYLRQQAGYGAAEAALRFKHPDKFNGRGHGKWRGVLYGASFSSLRLGGALIYRGVFGSGQFQCLYEPGPAHWMMLPSSLEWHLAAGLIAVIALFVPQCWIGVGIQLGLSVTVATLRACQARIPKSHDGLRSRLIIAALCYAQPLVRSWRRMVTRFFAYHPAKRSSADGPVDRDNFPLLGRRTMHFWAQSSDVRTALLQHVSESLREKGWTHTIDSGWSDWDLEIYCHPWTVLRVITAQENHDGGKGLIRARFQLSLSEYSKVLVALALLLGLIGMACSLSSLMVASIGILIGCGVLWWRGTRKSVSVLNLVANEAKKLGLTFVDQLRE